MDPSAISAGLVEWLALRAPFRQWMFIMAGQAAVRAGDGSRCDLRAGSICLLEDTRGKGHMTTITGSEEVLLVAVRIPDDGSARATCD